MRFGTAAIALSALLVTAASGTAVVVGVDHHGSSPDLSAQAAAISEPSVVPAPTLPTEPIKITPPLPAPATTTPAPAVVKPLRIIYTPDLVVRTSKPLTAKQISKLQHLDDLDGVAVFRTATIKVGSRKARAIGVDPSQFRSYTPQETAMSNELWQVVADGDLTSAFAFGRGLPLGKDVPVSSSRVMRLGARASFGLPDVDLVVTRAQAASFGANGGGAVLSASKRNIDSLERGVKKAVGSDATISVLRPKRITFTARPKTYRDLYIQSATLCPGLSWTILAAIGQIESGHGRNNGPSSAGALGPMQFLPSTWAYYGVDGDHDGTADINSPFDAVPAAAGYLCRNGAGRGGADLYNAIFAYNHADWYVRKVLALAAQFR